MSALWLAWRFRRWYACWVGWDSTLKHGCLNTGLPGLRARGEQHQTEVTNTSDRQPRLKKLTENTASFEQDDERPDT